MRNHRNLQLLIGTAGLDKSFCVRLLNGDRRRAITAFTLSEDEREIVLAIEADSLEAFAQALQDWIEQQDGAQNEAGQIPRANGRQHKQWFLKADGHGS